MAYETTWDSGEHNVICDICGCKVKSSMVQRTWDNLIVCPQDYEEKHPQLLPRPKFRDGRSVGPNARPEATDSFDNIDISTWSEANYNWEDVCLSWSKANQNGAPLYDVSSNGDSRGGGTAGGGDL